jgi:putative ABC transport system permease protein
MMGALKQIWSVSVMNLKSLPQRLGSSAVVVIGIAGVVGVLVSVMAMSSGLTASLIDAGHDDRVFVLRAGSRAEGTSSLSTDEALTIMDAPGIRRDADGKPLAAAELFVSVNMLRKEDDSRAGIVVRGIGEHGLEIRSEFKLVEGRMYQPGLRELIVGASARTEFRGLEIGDRVQLRDGPWSIVGAFETDGNAGQGNLFTDASTLQSAYQRPSFNSVRVWLESVDSFDAFADALTTNPSLNVEVITETDYFARQAEGLKPLFFVITNVVGGIMALGALFAALNTMYSAVSSRAVEIATLRAIGFGSGGVVVSVLIEGLLLAAIGALIGATASWLLFNGNTISLGGTTGSLITEMRVTPAVFAAGMAWALTVGLLGGLFPALRAARLPVATALRAI